MDKYLSNDKQLSIKEAELQLANRVIARMATNVANLKAEIEEIKEVEFPRRLEKVVDGWRNKCDELVAALEYHQEQTRPIQRTLDILAKVKK